MGTEGGPSDSVAEKRILIVEDDDQMIELLERMIANEGFQVEKAMDGQEALRMIGERAPDLIVLDLKLPKVGGMEILRELQAGDSARVPVIVITGTRADRETQALIKQEPNVRAFYQKPVTSAMLTMNIHSLLNTKPALRDKPLGW